MRGEIRAFAGEEGARPPLLVVQADALADAPTVTGLVVTTRPQRAGEPLTVALRPEDAGLGQPAWVKVTQLHTVPVREARERLGVVSAEVMERVDAALATVLGLSGAGSARPYDRPARPAIRR